MKTFYNFTYNMYYFHTKYIFFFYYHFIFILFTRKAVYNQFFLWKTTVDFWRCMYARKECSASNCCWCIVDILKCFKQRPFWNTVNFLLVLKEVSGIKEVSHGVASKATSVLILQNNNMQTHSQCQFLVAKINTVYFGQNSGIYDL